MNENNKTFTEDFLKFDSRVIIRTKCYMKTGNRENLFEIDYVMKWNFLSIVKIVLQFDNKYQLQ